MSRAEAKRDKPSLGPAPLRTAIRHLLEAPAAPESEWEGICRRLIPLLLIGVGLVAYHNSFAVPFLLDDFYRIVDNPQIHRLWPPWEVVAHSSRPVVQLSLAANYALGGLNVRGYHAFNLTVHLLAGLVLFGIVRRMLESDRLRARYGRAGPWLAGAVSLVWTVHPLQTESVTYIIQRGESLMGLFFLLTLYCGIRGAQSPHPRAWYSAAVIACALGMGTKEVMVAAPLMVLLYDRVFLAGSFAEIWRRRRGLYVSLAATWLLLGVLVATSRVEESRGPTGALAPWRYAMAQFGVIVHYLRLSLWPHPLVFDYTWRLPRTLSSVLPWAAAVLALLGGTALAFRRLPWVGFWGAWFFLILAPTSSILPLADLAFEHRMYLPLAAVAVLGVIGAHEALGLVLRWLEAPAGVRRWLEVGLAVTAVAALGTATGRRNEDYRSDLAIWSDTVAKRPGNPRAHNNLGLALDKLGKLDEAIAHYSQALRILPNYADAYNNLGNALTSQGQIEKAIAQYSEALRLDANNAPAHNSLGLALAKQGKLDEAIAHFAQVVRLKPESSDAQHNLGVALYREGRTSEAIAHYSEAIRLRPAFPEAHQNLGLALARQGKISEAIAHFAEAVRLKPDFAEAHNNLGAVLHRQGQIQEAIAHFAEAVRLKPDYAQAHNNLGVLLYNQGQLKEAIAHFAEAVRLKPDSADALNNLRAAQASLEQAKAKR